MTGRAMLSTAYTASATPTRASRGAVAGSASIRASAGKRARRPSGPAYSLMEAKPMTCGGSLGANHEEYVLVEVAPILSVTLTASRRVATCRGTPMIVPVAWRRSAGRAATHP